MQVITRKRKATSKSTSARSITRLNSLQYVRKVTSRADSHKSFREVSPDSVASFFESLNFWISC